MITVTDIAAKKINESIAKRGHGAGIRISVKTTGCSGFAYVVEYVDKYTHEAGVTNYAHKDFVVLVDAKSEVYLNNITVDWMKKGLNEGFEFINDQEKDRCGCGESFRV